MVIPSCVYFGLLLIYHFDKIAQLKVNLRPLWSPAAAALASLSQRFGDVVWKLFFEEVEKFACVTSSSPQTEAAQNPAESASNEEGSTNSDDPWEDERSWRDPSAHKLRSVVLDWDNVQSTSRAMQVSYVFNMWVDEASLTHYPFD